MIKSELLVDQNRSLIERFYKEIWEKKDFSPLSDLLHKDLDFKGSLGSQHSGLESFKSYVELIHYALDDYQCIIKETVIQPEKAFAKMQFKGKHIGNLLGFPPTQRTVCWDGAALFHFEVAKIKTLWVLGDVKQLESQLSKNITGE